MPLDIPERVRRYLRAIGPAIAGSGRSHATVLSACLSGHDFGLDLGAFYPLLDVGAARGIVNAAGADLVHVGMSSAHPIAITAGTDGTLYVTGLADDPIEVITYASVGQTSAWIDGMDGLLATVAGSQRDAAEALRTSLLARLANPEAFFRDLAERYETVATGEDPTVDGIDRAVAAAQGQAFLAAARIMFAAKQVARYEAEQHTAQREAAYKAGRS